MSRRQHVLNSPIRVDDMRGNAALYDMVRIIRREESPTERQLMLIWELGRMQDGTWVPASPLHSGMKTYNGIDYDAMASMSPADMADQVYRDLVAGLQFGAGLQEDY